MPLETRFRFSLRALLGVGQFDCYRFNVMAYRFVKSMNFIGESNLS